MLIWVIQIVVAVLFFLVASQKLISTDEVVANFRRWEMPDNFHVVIGVLEVLGAVGLLIPRTAGMAALGLMFIMVGAIYTHLTHDPAQMLVLPAVTFLLLGFVALNRNPMAIFGNRAQ